MPESVADWIDNAALSYEDGKYKRAQTEALIAIAQVMWALLPDDDDDEDGVPAGPIHYERYQDVKRC